MVGAGREHAEAPSSLARGARSSIPHAPLRRALLDSMATPSGPSSSTAVPSRGRGKKKRGGGARGGGRGGRVTLTAPSSPLPPAVSPEHVTARVPRPLLRWRVVQGLRFHTHLSVERCWTVWRHRRALLRRPRCPVGDEVRRREEVEHVVAGEEVG